MIPQQRVTPFYFGHSERPLFGCYHQPSPDRRRRCAVLICQPVGHEYINSHRALRQLAARFAEAGFPVLRFDYYGCGDSPGDAEDAGISEWREDIPAAIVELKRHSGLVEICVVGLRVGASLALMASCLRDDVESLVLWDPVENGRDYCDELLRLEKEMARFRPRRWIRKSTGAVEVGGFRFSSRLMAEIEEINLLASARVAVRNLLIINSSEEAESRLHHHLCGPATHVDWERVQAPSIWLPNAGGILLVPARLLQRIVSWTCGICS
jgi:uncharacterized protein